MARPKQKRKGREPMPAYIWDGEQLHQCLCNIFLGGESGYGTKGLVSEHLGMRQQAYSRIIRADTAPLQTLARIVSDVPGLRMLVEGDYITFQNYAVPGQVVAGASGPALQRPRFLATRYRTGPSISMEGPEFDAALDP